MWECTLTTHVSMTVPIGTLLQCPLSGGCKIEYCCSSVWRQCERMKPSGTVDSPHACIQFGHRPASSLAEALNQHPRDACMMPLLDGMRGFSSSSKLTSLFLGWRRCAVELYTRTCTSRCARVCDREKLQKVIRTCSPRRVDR